VLPWCGEPCAGLFAFRVPCASSLWVEKMVYRTHTFGPSPLYYFPVCVLSALVGHFLKQRHCCTCSFFLFTFRSVQHPWVWCTVHSASGSRRVGVLLSLFMFAVACTASFTCTAFKSCSKSKVAQVAVVCYARSRTRRNDRKQYQSRSWMPV